MPRVNEANETSKELQRGVTFETKIMPMLTKGRGMVSVVMVSFQCRIIPFSKLYDSYLHSKKLTDCSLTIAPAASVAL